jgi:hypothetical protein
MFWLQTLVFGIFSAVSVISKIFWDDFKNFALKDGVSASIYV